MQIHNEYFNPLHALVRPNGRMDVESSPAVRQAIIDLAGQGYRRVLVDLQAVSFMDSSGLSALVSGMKILRQEGGELCLCNANAQVQTALRLTMLDQVFLIYPTLEAALQAQTTSTDAHDEAYDDPGKSQPTT